jgi:hypothetical protein
MFCLVRMGTIEDDVPLLDRHPLPATEVDLALDRPARLRPAGVVVVTSAVVASLPGQVCAALQTVRVPA